ncbi:MULTISPECIES: polysaccharide deacetylase family protein [unclassified Leisingera]|uniref:polysaccharide deacetylase family protein n=1 Tax=unclassified Leisingera TaxID=2614906 RepID=UPI0003178B13|nr:MULTISPECIES: polysaccharide deacetylase family protein [unclassified Leisingera]KIC24694.1 polysaccharide deacetylase [Leisingera sp. ANG-S3]KIC55450.1 polysaccharide deacetylase [Leisingera sp. ANG-S]KID09182.1 polysaccharide deacetylase [Leisingera sp. ANG1]
MTADWSNLDRELDHWQEAGMTLPLWWRDDDAMSHSAELERLAALSEDLDLPVHLAVIPHGATLDLARFIAENPSLIPIVHGWAHQNHAPAGEKKAEFGAHRPLEELLDDAERGLTALQKMFGSSLRPMFVPPWNRISPDLLTWLAGAGFTAVSTFTPRKAAKPASGLLRVNAHLDPVDWKGSRGLLPPEQLIKQVVRQLRDRRLGDADNAEPYGLLTHHQVHDEAIWSFISALAGRLLAGPGEAWIYDERMS